MTKKIPKKLAIVPMTIMFTLIIIGTVSAASINTETTLTINPSTIDLGNSTTFTANLKRADNNQPLPGRTIDFYIETSPGNFVKINSNTTDEKGDASTTYTPSSTGTRTVGAIYEGEASGEDCYLTSRDCNPLTVNEVCHADLCVLKTRTSGSPVAGGTVSYLITVTNQGPTTINGFTLTDTTNPGLTGATYGTPSAGNYNPATGQWTGITLNTGQSVTITLTGTIPSSATGNLVNTAIVYPPAGIIDPDLSNNNSTVTDILSKVADLAVTKTDSPGPVKTGQTLTYTINVTNNGPSNITQFTLTDALPDGFNNPIYTESSGTYNPITGEWTGINLSPGQFVTLIITGTVNSGISETLTNTVTVTPPTGTTDPNLENNEASTTTTVIREANLAITKTVDKSRPVVKDIIHYTLIINNNGPDTAVNTQVADKLPAGLRFVSYTANYGTYDPATGIWTIGNLSNGARAVLTITSVVENSGIIINEAKVTSITTDPNLDDNTARVTINAQQPDEPAKPEVNAGSETVKMQETGIPVGMLVLAILAVLGGFITPKRK